MKLLIADDEELTRIGVVSSIDWKELGIDEVLQADDGIHGLEMAQKYQPEIILCDVRMPRMDGITMLNHVKHLLPDSVVIFMSGYSDKEYLKAAIRLKAVSYIEKPLNPHDIREAVLDAIKVYNQNKHTQRGKTLHSLETSSHLAALLSSPYVSNTPRIRELCSELDISFSTNTTFTVFIVKMDGMTEISQLLRTELYSKFEAFLNHFGMHALPMEKRGKYLIYFVYGNVSLFQSEIRKIGNFLIESCNFLDKYMVIASESYVGVEQAYLSYANAVVLLENSFFYPRNSFLSAFDIKNFPEQAQISSDTFVDTFSEAFASALQARDEFACTRTLEQIQQSCSCNSKLLQGQIKDFYYKLLFILFDARKQLLLQSSEKTLATEVIDTCFCYHDLHNALQSQVRQYFADASSISSENKTITIIKEYISQNYQNETLSVKDISTHVFLSTSYVCTFFKNETRQTLNQYLTEYRMEKAKALLADPRYKITDISAKVGYSDGNYFGKSFKKYCGLSPSEYRESILS